MNMNDRTIPIASFFLMLVSLLFTESICGAPWPASNSFSFDDVRYRQHLSAGTKPEYPDWNPGIGACPLHPTNAIPLALVAVSNALPDVVIDSHHAVFSLSTNPSREVWYYNVKLRVFPVPERDIVKPGSWIDVMVGVDGTVPAIRPLPRLTPEEQAKNREEVRANLRKYQMEVIRAGMAPLPIPLTQEMDEQLVAEGVLPPQNFAPGTARDLSPGFRRAPPRESGATDSLSEERQAQLREESREKLRQYQMDVTSKGMPPLDIPQRFGKTNACEIVPAD
jgi:hypothetical protein